MGEANRAGDRAPPPLGVVRCDQQGAAGVGRGAEGPSRSIRVLATATAASSRLVMPSSRQVEAHST